jgi:hypothetical protein
LAQPREIEEDLPSENEEVVINDEEIKFKPHHDEVVTTGYKQAQEHRE